MKIPGATAGDSAGDQNVDLLLAHSLCESILALVCFRLLGVYLYAISASFIALSFYRFTFSIHHTCTYMLLWYFLFGGMGILRDKPITQA